MAQLVTRSRDAVRLRGGAARYAWRTRGLGGDRIQQTLRELVRVSRRTVVLLEGRSGEREVMKRYPNTNTGVARTRR
jgi:hypothetical protein